MGRKLYTTVFAEVRYGSVTDSETKEILEVRAILAGANAQVP